jgi:hypothetical protein
MVKSMPPSNTDVAHRVGPSGLLRKTGGSHSAFFSIDRPMRSAAYPQLARQTLALCALGVQPKMRPGVFGCREPIAERYACSYPPVDICDGAARIQLRASAHAER